MMQFHLQKKLRGVGGDWLLDLGADISAGEFIVLFGPSGAGKTTLLRLLAGLEQADAGKILVEDRCWLDTKQKIELSPQARQVGMVFQDYALFPHLNVIDNLRFAKTKQQSEQVITDLIEIMELGDLQQQKPALLSGGQRQRVALARALVQRPRLLLLDEPLAAIDQQMRLKLQGYLQEIHRQFAQTILMVSHDKREAILLADRIFLLEKGKFSAQGTVEEVFGSTSRLRGKIVRLLPDQALVLIADRLVKVARTKEMKLQQEVIFERLPLPPN